MPRVSVCIPTYNRIAFLPKVIECALNQTFVDLEVLVVDNASTDETAEIVAGYSDARVRYIRNDQNLGMVRNWNRCFELARGEYVTIWSDDDQYDAQLVAEQSAVLAASPAVGLVYTAHQVRHVTGELVEVHPFSRSHQWSGTRELAYLSRRCYLYSPLLRMDVLRQGGGFNVQLGYAFDWELWLRCAYQCDVAYIDRVLITYQLHTQQMSNTSFTARTSLAAEWCRALESAYAHVPAHQRELHAYKVRGYCEVAEIHLLQAYWLLRQGRRSEARGQLAGAWYAIVHKAGWRFLPYVAQDTVQFIRKRRAGQTTTIFPEA
ncbi:MAG: glycosyltransferase [Anaerolineae bacterium]